MGKKFGISLLVGVMFLANPGVANAQVQAGSSGPQNSAEDAFSAAFFGTGPLATGGLGVVLPEEVSRDDYDSMAQETVDLLSEAEPVRFEAIAEDLTSGSPVSVENALEDGLELVVDVTGEEGADVSEVAPQCGPAVVCVAFAVALSVAALQNSAVATTAAVATQALWVEVGVGSADVSLEHEQMVAEVARQLAA